MPVASPPPVAESPKLDPVSSYEQEVKAVLSAPVPEGFVDPHVQELRDREGGDVDPVALDDVDPPTLATSDGPSDAELRMGDTVDTDTPVDDVDGPQALPTDEPVIDTDPQPIPQYRTRPVDKIEERAFQLRKESPTKPLEQCLAEAKAELAPPQQAEPEVTLPKPEELRDERTATMTKWMNAVRNLADDAEIDELQAKIVELDKQIPQAEQQHARAAQAEAQRFQESADQAVTLYPDAAVEGSPLYQRMEEIHRTMEETGDTTIHHPRKALIIAQMAARELSIAPRNPGKAGTASKPAAQQPNPASTAPRSNRGHVPMTAPLASSGARTSPGPTPLDKLIDAVSTPDGYETLTRSLLRGRR